MLVLKRKIDQLIRIEVPGDLLVSGRTLRIDVMAVEHNADACKIGIEAPREVIIHRKEVWDRIHHKLRNKR